MRLTVCLEGNEEGRVLASVDMEDIVKMTVTDDIEKSNFNPQMLKSCTDTSYQCGYEQGRSDAIDELSNALCDELDKGYVFINKHQIVHFAEQLKAGGMNEYNI